MDKLFAGENDFLDILIYAVFIIAGLAANAYRNYAKKKEEERRRQEQPTEEELPDAFPDLEYEYEEPKEIIPDEPEYYEEEVTEQPVQEYEQEIREEENIEVEEGNAVFESTSNQLLSDNIESVGDSIFDEIGQMENQIYSLVQEEPEAFNLRDAVIYSEILKRKYY
ncbi:MAG: hypothetical protein JW894_16460 [Bacteroidales bacterium]|nr:hypothetical protein [Bacteroidales bacterium]